MANSLRITFTGDRFKAYKRKWLGVNQLSYLLQDMKVNDLKHGKRTFSLNDGTVITCISYYGNSFVNVYCPVLVSSDENIKVDRKPKMVVIGLLDRIDNAGVYEYRISQYVYDVTIGKLYKNMPILNVPTSYVKDHIEDGERYLFYTSSYNKYMKCTVINYIIHGSFYCPTLCTYSGVGNEDLRWSPEYPLTRVSIPSDPDVDLLELLDSRGTIGSSMFAFKSSNMGFIPAGSNREEYFIDGYQHAWDSYIGQTWQVFSRCYSVDTGSNNFNSIVMHTYDQSGYSIVDPVTRTFTIVNDKLSYTDSYLNNPEETVFYGVSPGDYSPYVYKDDEYVFIDKYPTSEFVSNTTVKCGRSNWYVVNNWYDPPVFWMQNNWKSVVYSTYDINRFPKGPTDIHTYHSSSDSGSLYWSFEGIYTISPYTPPTSWLGSFESSDGTVCDDMVGIYCGDALPIAPTSSSSGSYTWIVGDYVGLPGIPEGLLYSTTVNTTYIAAVYVEEGTGEPYLRPTTVGIANPSVSRSVEILSSVYVKGGRFIAYKYKGEEYPLVITFNGVDITQSIKDQYLELTGSEFDDSKFMYAVLYVNTKEN